MIVSILNDIATSLGMHFTYARRDFANLADHPKDETIYMVLDPVETSVTSDPQSLQSHTSYSGRFMILSVADLDDASVPHDEREQVYYKLWETYIKPKIETSLAGIINAIGCAKTIDLVSYSTIDVLNIFDNNMSGIIVNFKIKQL